jgi:hypothetical protein
MSFDQIGVGGSIVFTDEGGGAYSMVVRGRSEAIASTVRLMNARVEDLGPAAVTAYFESERGTENLSTCFAIAALHRCVYGIPHLLEAGGIPIPC